MLHRAAVNDRFERGARLFHEGAWFEAHEAWESCWRDARDPDARRLYQALVQVAAAFHKLFVVHDAASAGRILRRALAKLDALPASVAGVDVERLRGELARRLDSIDAGELAPSDVPRLR
jgi:hypothetical protein